MFISCPSCLSVESLNLCINEPPRTALVIVLGKCRKPLQQQGILNEKRTCTKGLFGKGSLQADSSKESEESEESLFLFHLCSKKMNSPLWSFSSETVF
jgi:hypothetical protein